MAYKTLNLPFRIGRPQTYFAHVWFCLLMTFILRFWTRGTFIVLYKSPKIPIWGWVTKPKIISMSTLDYLNNMCRSGFDNSEPFKSYGGGGIAM